jgi:hypothetical protein
MSGSAHRLKIGIFIPDIPPTPLHILIAIRSTLALYAKGRLSRGMPPPNSFPFTLSCPGAFIVVLPHILRVVFLWNAICGVSRLSGTLLIPSWRARGAHCWKPSPAFSWCSRQNLLLISYSPLQLHRHLCWNKRSALTARSAGVQSARFSPARYGCRSVS